MLSPMKFISVFFIVLAFAIAGCTRPTSDSAKLKIVLPSQGPGSLALGTEDVLGHVVINVTGEGIASPILLTWDSCRDCTNAPSAPPSFVIDVPMGNSRLVQVLAVYMNSTSNTMKFYYGDRSQNFSNANESVTVPITAIGSNTAIVTGRISGRYLTSANAGPTGPLELVYTPTGKPSLVIERSTIVNGWFHVFGLAGLPLGYRTADGNLLFGKPIDLNDSALAPSQSVLKVAIPAHYRQENRDGTNVWLKNEPSLAISGFFGPGVDSTRFSCRPTSMSTLTKMARANSPDGSQLLTYSASPIPTLAALLDTTSPLPSYYMEGGDSSSSVCTTQATNGLYLNYLNFTQSRIDGNGNDSLAGFTVPFEWNANGSAYTIDSSNPRVISAKLLPGAEIEIDAVQLFKRPTADNNFWLEQIDCAALAGGSMGFVPAGTGTVDASTRALNINSNISSAEVTAGVSAAICPMKAGKSLPQGIFVAKWNFSSGMGGGGGGGGGPVMAGPPHHLKITARPSVNSYACTWVDVEVVDAQELRTTATNSLSFNVTSASGLAQISTGSCMSGPASVNLSIPAGTQMASFYFKGGYMSSTTDQIVVNTIAGVGLPSTMVNVARPIVILPSNTITQIVVDGSTQSSLNQNSCLELKLKTADSMSTMVVPASNLPATISVNNFQSGALQLFTNSSCTNPLPVATNNVTFTSGVGQLSLYVKGSQLGSGEIRGSLTQNFTIDSVSTNIESPLNFFMQVVPASAATRLALSPAYTNSQANSGNCLPMNVTAQNDSSSPVLVSGNASFWSQGGMIDADFYSDSTCSSYLTPGMTIPFSNQSNRMIYFRPKINYSSTNETLTLGASLNGSNGSGGFFNLPGLIQTSFSPTKFQPIVKIAGTAQTLPVPLSATAGTCAAISYELRTIANVPIPNETQMPLLLSLGISPSPMLYGQFYSDAACTTSMGTPLNFTIPPNASVSTETYYIRSESGAYGQSYQFYMQNGLPPGIQWVPSGDIFILNN